MEAYQNKRKPTGLLVGGLIVNIFSGIVSFIGVIIVIVIFGIAVALGTTAGAVVAGEEGAQQAAQNVEFTPELAALFTVGLVFLIYSMVAFPLTIVALVLCSKAKGGKMCIAAGILALIASIPGILIPLELIGGIRLVRMRDRDFQFDPNYWHD